MGESTGSQDSKKVVHGQGKRHKDKKRLTVVPIGVQPRNRQGDISKLREIRSIMNTISNDPAYNRLCQAWAEAMMHVLAEQMVDSKSS